MSLIVAGRFTTFPAAEAAADRLFMHGFVEEDVNLFFVNPRGQHARHAAASGGPAAAPPPALPESPHVGRDVTAGAVAGAVLGVLVFGGLAAPFPIVVLAAAVGSYIGARIGAQIGTSRERDPHPHREVVHHETRDSGVLLAVHVSPDNQVLAAELLRDSGGADIERASGRWQGGHWADFDPTKPPTPYGEAFPRHA
jgi:hypothetical protein